MSGNATEWSTETDIEGDWPAGYRGGYYDVDGSIYKYFNTAARGSLTVSTVGKAKTFRPVLYLSL